MIYNMMVGIPYSGKSTFVNDNASSKYNFFYVYSTDDRIEEVCRQYEVKYEDYFKKLFDFATAISEKQLFDAIDNKMDIWHDQTNLTINSRKRKLNGIPKYYKKIAYVMGFPSTTELERRMSKRTGKIVPMEIINQMITSYQPPTIEEGFDEIKLIEQTNV